MSPKERSQTHKVKNTKDVQKQTPVPSIYCKNAALCIELLTLLWKIIDQTTLHWKTCPAHGIPAFLALLTINHDTC